MNDQPMSVPAEPYIQAISEQRNQALDQVAEQQALIAHYRSENERLIAENEKLRAEEDGPLGGS